MSKSCLIVDDNEAFLAAASLLLERQGLKVAGVAASAEEALRQVERLRPDVVLLDISLGRDNGVDVAQRLVAEHLCDQAVVVLTSTRAEDDVSELIQDCPSASFLPKAELSAGAIAKIVTARRRGPC